MPTGGRLCSFQVETDGEKKVGRNEFYPDVYAGLSRSLYLMLKQIDVIMQTGVCHQGGGESLICHSLSAGLFPKA